MQTEQIVWSSQRGWSAPGGGKLSRPAQLVLVFGATPVLSSPQPLHQVAQRYPQAQIFGCSTAGEICGSRVFDDTLVATAISFNRTEVVCRKTAIGDGEESYAVGERLARSLEPEGLTHVLVLSDGLHVNGSELVRGLIAQLPEQIRVTGGLSGDGARFASTLVVADGEIQTNAVAILGLYGTDLQVGFGSLGGWDPFGPERLITKSEKNILYELDGHSALELYKKYLGKHAEGLPATGLLFPLSLRFEDRQQTLVRTILAVDEKNESLIFAGDVPEGAFARLMRANFDRLVDGAVLAAKSSYQSIGSFAPELALLISCVGRKMILKQRVEEEVEGVTEVLGRQTCVTGFYSYGEISPGMDVGACDLHNQTMTITVFAER